MTLMDWLFEQKLSDWVQGIGSLAAAVTAVMIASRQERNDRHRDEQARVLRRKVLAAAIAPILRDMNTTARLRNGLVQTIGRNRGEEAPPRPEELLIALPDIFLSTIERIDVFGARIASEVYTLIHRVNDYNKSVQAQREYDVPVRTWGVNLRPKLDAILETLDVLLPHMQAEVGELENVR